VKKAEERGRGGEGERGRGGEGRVSYSKLLTHQKKIFFFAEVLLSYLRKHVFL